MSGDEYTARIEKLVRQRDVFAKQMQKAIENFAVEFKNLANHDLKIYKELEKPDCLYSDSPISEMITVEWVKQNLIKLDLDWVGLALDGKQNLKTFLERAQDASKWVLRFAKPKEKEKTGIEAML